jgi:hypothetical protein
MIKRLDPTFDTKDYGFVNFPAMVKAMEPLIEIRKGELDQVVILKT